MAELQDGIYHRPGDRPGKFFAIAFFRAARGLNARAVGGALQQLWSMWQDLRNGLVRDLPDAPVDGGNLTVLLGLGPKAFELDGAGRLLPEGLEREFLFRSPKGGGGGPLLGLQNHLAYADDVRENRATEEVAVQFIADSKLAVDRAIVETWKLLHDTADPVTGSTGLEFTTFYLGFQRDDHRSWIDFHDGISNLRSDEREQVIAIERSAAPRRAWLECGTYLAFLRLEVDIRAWRTLDRPTQELLVGRDKLTGCPLVSEGGEVVRLTACPIGGAPIWASENDPIAEPPAVSDVRLRQSHIHRANQHRRPASSRESSRIFRQGYEFLEWKESAPGFRLGLNFVSFQDTTERLIRILSQPGWLGDVNFGGDPDAQPLGIDRLLRVYAAGVYVVPPKVSGEPFPGASVFGEVDVAVAPSPGI
jgi:deferrochelatase/peroxidase EfeB